MLLLFCILLVISNAYDAIDEVNIKDLVSFPDIFIIGTQKVLFLLSLTSSSSSSSLTSLSSLTTSPLSSISLSLSLFSVAQRH